MEFDIKFKKGEKAYVVASNPGAGLINIVHVEVTGFAIESLQKYESVDGKINPLPIKEEINYGFLYENQPQVTNFMFKTRSEAIEHAESQIPEIKKKVEEENKRTEEHLKMVNDNFESMKRSLTELLTVPAKEVDPKPIPDEQPAKD